MKAPSIAIVCGATDHAVLRYLERVMGLDIATIRAEVARIGQLGVDHDAPVVISGGHKFIVEQGRVITVLSKDCRAYRRRGDRGRAIHDVGADRP